MQYTYKSWYFEKNQAAFWLSCFISIFRKSSLINLLKTNQLTSFSTTHLLITPKLLCITILSTSLSPQMTSDGEILKRFLQFLIVKQLCSQWLAASNSIVQCMNVTRCTGTMSIKGLIRTWLTLNTHHQLVGRVLGVFVCASYGAANNGPPRYKKINLQIAEWKKYPPFLMMSRPARKEVKLLHFPCMLKAVFSPMLSEKCVCHVA